MLQRTIRRHLVLAVALVALTACSGPESGNNGNNGSACSGGKCDALAPPALSVVSSQFGVCETVPDLEAVDDFFALEREECRFVTFDESIPATFQRVFTYARLGDNRYTRSVEYTAEELVGEPKTAAKWRTDSYPVTVEIQPFVSLVLYDYGRLGSPRIDDQPISVSVEHTIDSRPEANVEHAVALPMEFWPVVVWPTTEFADKWNDGAIDFFAVNIEHELQFDGVRGRSAQYGRFAFAGADLKELPNTTFTLPVQPESSKPQLELRLDSDEATTTLTLEQPGYYLLDADGSVTLATPAQIQERGMVRRQVAADPVDMGGSLDAGGSDAGVATDAAADAGSEPDASTVLNPCNGACNDTEVCVENACVARADQVQTSCSSSPTAACDDGEDADCAAGHACVNNLCRKIECQEQDTLCNPPRGVCDGEDTDCPADHVCADGQCKRLSCQEQDRLCNPARGVCDGEDTDCPLEHVCVDGSCLRLSCQEQDTLCNPPQGVCEGDTDCPDEHVCTDGRCIRLSCKEQDTLCNPPSGQCDGADNDCPDGHVCSENICRRLSCQEQDTLCNAPQGSCDGEDTDCPDEHACVAGRCLRLSCQEQDTLCNPPQGTCDDGEDSDCPDGHVCLDGACQRLTCL